VLVLNRLTTEHLEQLLQRAEQHTKQPLPLDPDARTALKAMADGDGRFLLNLVEEILAQKPAAPLTTADLARSVQKRAPIYDKGREGHYNLISALHKSVRGSDPDAALYWLARMLAGGEDPLYIARRVVRMAVEDIGLADPQALVQAIAAKDAFDFLGSPEGELAIAQAVLYVAAAPKSNAAYKAFGAAKEAASRTGSLAPPMHILNAPTKMMKDLGYGKNYVYDPETPEGFSGQNYFPDDVERESFYRPTEFGMEKHIKARLDRWAELRGKKK
jgi:putative ATPase